MMKKRTLGLVSAGVLLAGGVSAYVILDKTPKEAYLYAEYKTAQKAYEFVTERYEDEFEWMKKTQKEVTKNDVDFSLSVEDYDYNYNPDIINVVNSSSLNVSVVSDPKKKQFSAGVGATILDYSLDPFTFYLTEEDVMLELPFQEETLAANLNDLGDMIETITDEDMCLREIDFSEYIRNNGLLTEEDLNYILKEYGKIIYKAIPEDAFTKNDNTITMEMRGRDLEKIIVEIVESAEGDRELARILDRVILSADPCSSMTGEDFLAELVNELDDLRIDGDIYSKVWLDGNIITKRVLEFDEIEIKGKQKFDKELSWDYDFIEDGETVLTIEGDLGAGERIKDSIIIDVDGGTITYNSNEKKNKDKRDFSREFYFNDNYDEFKINWDGETSISGDKMRGEHEFFIDIPYEGSMGLVLKNDSVITKSLTIPSKSVDLTDMTSREIEEYLEYEVAPNIERWGDGLFEEIEDILYYY